MKMRTASTLAALALGLMVSGSAVYAADRSDKGDHGDQNTQRSNDQNDHKRGDKPPKVEGQTPVYPGAEQRRGRQNNGHHDKPIWNANNGNNNPNANATNGNNRNRDWNANNRNNDNNANWNRRNRDRHPDWNTNNANNDSNRRHTDLSLWHRNFDSPRQFHAGSYRAPRGYYYRRYSYGQRLPRDYYERNFWLADFLTFGLLSPPDGYVWVRYGPDALLIDEETGEIIQVRYNVFY